MFSSNTTKAKPMPNHNLEPGPVTKCQICGSSDLELVMDLGCQPLCDTLVAKEGLGQPEVFYPLAQLWCKECTLNQLSYTVPGDVVYHQNYPYKSGVTKELAIYQQELAATLVSDLKIATGSLVVDIGSNDGTLLTGFRNLGMDVCGVEPTNIAHLANEAGISTIHAPFNDATARRIVSEKGQANVVTATNVFAHMASLGDVMQGLEILISDNGYFCLENHYLGAVIERLQFDTIYHEHLRTYSLHSLMKLFNYYDFTVVDARKVSRYGGNIRVYVAKGKKHTPNPSVQALLDEELQAGMNASEYYARFREKSIQLKNNLVSLLLDLKKQGKTIVGNSCPGRCSTLLNYAGIGPDILPYLAEQPQSLKLGHYLPGKHIPIVNNQRLIDEQPDYVVLFAWHYAEPIMEQLRARGLRSKFILPMPEVRIIEN